MVLMTMSSSLSWAVNKHFCGEHLMEVSFFYSTEGCGMESDQILKLDSCDSVSQESCCSDILIKVESHDEIQVLKTYDLALTLDFLGPITVFELILKEDFDLKLKSQLPPLEPDLFPGERKQAIHLLFEQFLI